MSLPVTIRLMQPVDEAILYTICREAYSRNFHHHWTGDGLAWYLEKVFGREVLHAELADPHIRYYVAFSDQEPVAFMKLNLFSNLPGEPPEKGLELDKLYILPDYKGSRVGGTLVDLAFRFHSTTRVPYPLFREELKGMWRMMAEVGGSRNEGT